MAVLCITNVFPLLFAGVQKCTGTDHQFCLRDVLSLTSRPAHSVHLWPHGVLPQHQWPHRLCYSGMDVFIQYVLSLTRKEWHHLFCCVLAVAFEWVKPGGSRAAAEVIQPGGQLHHQPLSVYCCGSEAVPFLPHSQSRADGTSLRWVCHSGPVNWGKPWALFQKMCRFGFVCLFVHLRIFVVVQNPNRPKFLISVTYCSRMQCPVSCSVVCFRYSWFCCQNWVIFAISVFATVNLIGQLLHNQLLLTVFLDLSYRLGLSLRKMANVHFNRRVWKIYVKFCLYANVFSGCAL